MKDWSGSARGAGHASHAKELRDALRAKLLDYRFSHFITLASNHQPLSYGRMRALLKEWDARVNRQINGPKWHKRPDERLVWFAFPEKLDVNPHWHLVVEVDPDIESEGRAARTRQLPEIGRRHWLNLSPQGSFDCQSVETPKVVDYVTKMSSNHGYFERFILCREFMNI